MVRLSDERSHRIAQHQCSAPGAPLCCRQTRARRSVRVFFRTSMSSTKVTDISAHRASLARRAPLYAVPTKRLVRPNQPLTQWLQWLGNAGVVVGLLYVLALQRTGGFDEHYRVLAVASVL